MLAQPETDQYRPHGLRLWARDDRLATHEAALETSKLKGGAGSSPAAPTIRFFLSSTQPGCAGPLLRRLLGQGTVNLLHQRTQIGQGACPPHAGNGSGAASIAQG